MCEPSFYSCGIGVGIGIRWIGFDRMWEYNVGIGGERYMLIFEFLKSCLCNFFSLWKHWNNLFKRKRPLRFSNCNWTIFISTLKETLHCFFQMCENEYILNMSSKYKTYVCCLYFEIICCQIWLCLRILTYCILLILVFLSFRLLQILKLFPEFIHSNTKTDLIPAFFS